ncbi:MAG: hypothetical protein ACFFC7_23120 [Candidatus Hermodarchaeota archaeon]
MTSRRYAAERLHQLRSAGIFQTFFKLYHVGLQVRYYLLAIGSASHLAPLAQFVCQLPRYQVWKGANCLFALLWITPELQELVQRFLSSLQSLDFSVLLYGKISTHARAHSPNLPELWNEETGLWYSEPEW